MLYNTTATTTMAVQNSGSEVLTGSDLVKLLRDPVVQNFNKWEELGLELDLDYSCLENIRTERHDKTDDCKRDMLSTWLKSVENPTLDDVHKAIKRIKDRNLRQATRQEAENETKKMRDAIQTISEVLDKESRDTSKLDDKLQSDLRDLEGELKHEEEWMANNAEQWDEENDQWKKGETAADRTNIMKALEVGRNFKDDEFVVKFLRSKRVTNLFLMKDRLVESMLRKALIDIDANRLQVLAKRSRIAKRHQRRLENIQNEIKAQRELINRRLVENEELIRNIEVNLGVRTDKLKKRNERLKKTAENCDTTNEQCYTIYTKCKNSLSHWKGDIEDYRLSFNRNVNEMTKKKSTFMITVLEIPKWPVVVGVAAGGAMGYMLPRVRRLVGVSIGAATGGVVCFASIVIFHRDDNNKQALERARSEKTEIDKMLAEDE